MPTSPPYVNHTAQRNDTATAVPSVAVPGGVVDGQVLLACLSLDDSALNTITPPSGFSLLRTASTASPADVQSLHLFAKLAAGETGPYVFTLNGSAVRNSLIVVAYSGAKLPTIGQTSINSTNTNTGDPTTAIAAAITTTSAENTIVNFTASDDTGGVTAITHPTGYAERYDSAGGASNAVEFSDIAQSAAGSTGAVTTSIIGGTQVAWLVAMVALEPLDVNDGTYQLTSDLYF